LLTAATAALLSGPALADETISNKVTVAQYTGDPNDEGTITITSTGSVVLTGTPTTPVITLNGGATAGTAADVINMGTISYTGQGSSTNPLTGVELIGTNVDLPTGGFDSAAAMDFSGAGSNKTGILVATGTISFIGDIGCTQGGVLSGGVCSVGTPVSQLTGVQDTNLAAILLESGSTLKIQGDASYGIDIQQGATLGDVCANCGSDIDIAGSLTMTPPSSTSLSSVANGIYIAGTLNGDLNLIQGGTISVEGTNSYGINIVAPDTTTSTPGGVVNGNIIIDGVINVTPISPTSLTAGNNIAMYLGGTINGNVDIDTGGEVTASGEAAQGIVIAGPINGYFENQNLLETYGVSAPSQSGGNPEGGTALSISASISGGILNAGPVSDNDTTDASATISTGGAAPTVLIAPNTTSLGAITIGTFTSQGDEASFINRGLISNGSANADPSGFTPTSLEILGDTAAYTTTLTSGIFNSGSISSSAFTDSKGLKTDSTVDILIGAFADIEPSSVTGAALTNSNEVTDKPGNISASIAGDAGGQATAIEIAFNAILPSILNEGTIIATATTTNTDLTLGAVQATAIDDKSGTLTSIINDSGATIEAFASTLSDDSQVAVAVDVSANTSGVTIDNMGSVIGDVRFGSGNDTFTVEGTGSNTAATMTGNIYFGGNSTGGADFLHIGEFGTVTGQIYSGTMSSVSSVEEQGQVNVLVDAEGNLNLLTAASSTGLNSNQNSLTAGTWLTAGNFDLSQGSNVDIHYSQAFNTDFFANTEIIQAQTEATIDTTNLTFTPDSFITPPLGEKSAIFVIIDTPILTLAPGALMTINNNFIANLSYLYSPLQSSVSEGVGNLGQALLLTITPKVIGADGCKTQQTLGTSCNLNDIPLTGFAAKMFPYVNVALGNDNGLGSAMIQSITNSYTAENAYTAFAPDVSGATRALAISLTDDATSIVAARQKELREYANQDGDLTLWGQQIVQRLSQAGDLAGPGYHDSGFGFALGADEGDPVDGRYGAAFTFFSGDSREVDPGLAKTTSEWYMLTGYTDWRGKGLFLDTNASVGYVNLNGNRYLDLQIPQTAGGFLDYNRDAQEHHPGELLSGGVTTGAVFDESGTVITPQVSLDGLTMREESYSESGGGNGMDLHVASSYEQSVRGFVGFNVRQDFDFTDFLLQPDITAGYRYDFANGAQSLKAEFESVQPPSVFEITGPKPDAGNAVVQGGVAVSTGAWSLGLSFDYLKAGSGNTAEQGTITLLGRI
jgi:hypothetical protein